MSAELDARLENRILLGFVLARSQAAWRCRPVAQGPSTGHSRIPRVCGP